MKKIKQATAIAAALSICAASFCGITSYAKAEKDSNVKIVLDDITAEDTTVMAGEAKVRVSVSGLSGDMTISQIYFDFAGDLKYKSVKYLTGKNDPDNGSYLMAPNAASVNTSNRIPTSITSVKSPIKVEGDTQLFELTFEGTGSTSLSLEEDPTYITVNGKDILPGSVEGDTSLTASTTGVEAVTATVNFNADDVKDFPSGSDSGYSGTGVFVTVTDTTKNIVYNTELNNVPISKGGNYDASKSGLNFVVTNEVIKGDVFEVSVSCEGYETYTVSGVSFDNGDVVSIKGGDLKKVEPAPSDAPTETATPRATTPPSSGGGGGGGGGGTSSTTTTTTTATPTATATAKPTEKPSTTATPSNDGKFKDLGGYDWASEAIYMLKDKGIIGGTSDNEYSPANNIRRGDFMLILSRMLNLNEEIKENFSDVAESDYYYKAIGMAKAAGIAQGSDNKFMPQNNITRQELITLAYRAFAKFGYIGESDSTAVLDEFSDKGEIAEYAQSAMAAMVKAGIIQGNDGKVNPKGNATRAEAAVMCSRLIGLIK